MLAVDFPFADGAAFARMLATVEEGLPLPGHLASTATGEWLVVHFRIGKVVLPAKGHVALVAGERRIIIADGDLQRLRHLVSPSAASVSLGAVSGDSVGGATEVMSRFAFGGEEATLDETPTPSTGFAPGLGLAFEPTAEYPSTSHEGDGFTSGRRRSFRPTAPRSTIGLALPGRTLGGKYVVAERLGAGSMGAVFRGKQLPLGTEVAIKAMHPELASAPTFAERFFREAKAAALLDHPGAVRVIDYGVEDDGLAYLVTEFVKGRNLASVLEQDGRLSAERAADIVLQVLAVLGKAHDVGMVHRDVKADNVMLMPSVTDDGDRAEIVKLCDFGIAKVLESAGPQSPSASLTAQGYIVGTPEYMSPEQAQGDPVDGRSDLYSVGVMLFHLVTGVLPFEEETAVKVMIQHVTKTVDPPSKRRAGVDPRFDDICLTAMAKKPEDRYPNARAMRRAIRLAFLPPGMAVSAGSITELPPLRRGDVAAGRPAAITSPASADAPPAGRPVRRWAGRESLRRLPPVAWMAVSVALGLVMALAAMWWLRAP